MFPPPVLNGQRRRRRRSLPSTAPVDSAARAAGAKEAAFIGSSVLLSLSLPHLSVLATTMALRRDTGQFA